MHSAEQLYKTGHVNAALAKIEHTAESMTEGVSLNLANHSPRILHYPRIERLVWRIANAHMEPTIKLPQPKKVTRVLHVATLLYIIGGHTRIMQNFIRSDKSSREHSAFIRHWDPNPKMSRSFYQWLLNIPYERLHQCTFLPTAVDYYLSCGKFLRNLSLSFDAIVTHTHMFDVVPVLAFSDGYYGPPVAFWVS